MSTDRAPTPPKAADAAAAASVAVPATDDATELEARTVTSATLLRGAAELRIDHGGVIYRLKQTALGKLILTK